MCANKKIVQKKAFKAERMENDLKAHIQLSQLMVIMFSLFHVLVGKKKKYINMIE